MTIKEKITKKALKFLGMLDSKPEEQDDLTFINDRDRIRRQKLREYNVWYLGDSDELLNFYTHANNIEYNYEPFYDRNKRGYFWAISGTEQDIKRTHSGQLRNIVDTLVNIVDIPVVKGGITLEKNKKLEDILEDNNFWELYKQQQMPMTLVEGWGAYKISWDKSLSDYPIVDYYKAENVDFVYKSNRLVGIIFKDYYTDEKGKKYLIIETRRLENKNLHIEYELYNIIDKNEHLKEVDFESVPEFAYLKDISHLEIEGFNELLAVPCIFFKDTDLNMYGRSVFAGKIDLADDLDQCLSQSSNTVRKSTPTEYFNTDFLERDRKTGMPLQPKVYDRKYVMYAGGKTVDGASTSKDPVMATQPQLNFLEYSQEAQQILFQMISGLMSPATLGIDVAKKDNAEAQREKEKITVFTRNAIIKSETRILRRLFSQLLCVQEYLERDEISVKEYDISVKFAEFADASFESKLSSLVPAMQTQVMSPKMFVDKLYGDTLTAEEKEKEVAYIASMNEQRDANDGPDNDKDNDGIPNEEMMEGLAEVFE